MSSRDPYFQFAWDSTVPGEEELEMDDDTLGIRKLHGFQNRHRHTINQSTTLSNRRTQSKPSSLLENPYVLSAPRLRSQSPSGLVSDFHIVALLALTGFIFLCCSAPIPRLFIKTNKVSTHFATALAIREDNLANPGMISRPPDALAPSFEIGRLLSMKKRLIDPKVVIETLTSVWDLYNLWVEIFGLPPRLFIEEAAGKVRDLLGQVLFPDKIGLRRGTLAKVRLIHDVSDLVREVFPPMPFEFDLGDLKATLMLLFKYERVLGFCRVCGLLEHRS
ncbi:hypothetical protein ACLB2K_004298 [Fragaria x ananassa]